MTFLSRITDRDTPTQTLIFLGIFCVYLLLRLLAWSNASNLEDHDSVSYLSAIEVFRTLDIGAINNLSADRTPFYPLFSALFSSLTGSAETGARLCSLFFSCLLFAAVVGIGRQFATAFSLGIGLLIIAFNPVLIRLSYSVLTEPSYVAVVYLGLWLFMVHYRQPKVWTAAALGTLFALAFLNRFEGILYLAVIPLLQVVHFVVDKQMSRHKSLNLSTKSLRKCETCALYVAVHTVYLVSYRQEFGYDSHRMRDRPE